MLACPDIGASFVTSGNPVFKCSVIGMVLKPTPKILWPRFVAELQELLSDAPGRFAAAIAGLVDPRSGKATCATLACIDGRANMRELGGALGSAARPIGAAALLRQPCAT
jgi:N-acetylglucosamine kinase